MIEAGRVLQNRYRVSKQIGQGGMGAVYVAVDERFGSTVAIKETLFFDEKYCKAFEREARLLNSLRHPALPVVTDHFVEGNGQFIVMEYIAGEDLAEQLAKNGKPFPLKEVLVWADQLLDALEFLHNQEIPVIHRDIKPQNLKLTKRNQIILLDFGLAKGNPTDLNSNTAAKSIFGYSPGYASLEQIQGTGTEPRSDLYSLSATLYHLMTGVPPTDALTRAMSVLNEREDPLPPANLVNRKIPAGVAEVLHKAMALNAGHRPASAAIMRKFLAEGEKEEVSDFATFTDKPLPTDIFTQNTRLFENKNVPQSEVKTEVLTAVNDNDEISRETRAVNQNPPHTKSGGASRRYAVGAAVFGFLLLLGAGMFALNVFEDHQPVRISNQNEVSDKKVESNTEPPKTENFELTTEAASDNSAADEANLKSAAPVIKKETAITEAPVRKTTETTKNSNEEETPVIVNDPEEGNIKIYKDRIETDAAIVESNRILLKNGGKITAVRPLSPEQIKRLSLEQRRKINRARMLQKRFPNAPQPPPPPKPTPENK
jgi:serine/threonine protein kinase